jgi:hypothetical protein
MIHPPHPANDLGKMGSVQLTEALVAFVALPLLRMLVDSAVEVQEDGPIHDYIFTYRRTFTQVVCWR